MTTTLTHPTAHLPESPSTGTHRAGRTTLRLVALELRLLAREPIVAVSLIGFPLVTVLVLAGVFGQAPDPDFGGVAPSDHYIAGYIGVVLASMGLITIPVHVATERELGVRRRLRASGVSSVAIVAREIVLGVVLGVISVAVVLAAGTAVYGLQMPDDPIGVAGWFVAGLVCFIAIGVALGTMVPTGRSAAALGNFVFVPMFLLGGGGPPRAVMTSVMHRIGDVLPLSHVIGGLRQSWLGTTDDPRSLWYPMLVAAVAVALAVRIERRRAG